MDDSLITYIIVRKIEHKITEVFPFNNYKDAIEFYEKAKDNWSDTFFCKVLMGPKK